MIYIGICDDDKEHRTILYETAFKAVFEFGEVEFSYYSSGVQLLEEIEHNRFRCELLLLDINMPEVDGLRAAAYIRGHQIDVDIIFVTVSAEHVFDGYTYQAFSYVLKPLNHGRLSDELKRYMKLKSNAPRCLHVRIGGRKVQIFLDRVKYFAADGRKIFVCQRGESERLSFYAKISDLQKTLEGEKFLRCHQSYLVNTAYVQSYSRTELDVGDDAVPVSRRYVENVRNYFGGKE